MRILDLFAGIGGERRRLSVESRGHDYVTLDLDPRHGCTITADVMELTAEKLGKFDFVWASPPCETFSVASIGHHWQMTDGRHLPKTREAVFSQLLVKHTLEIIHRIAPPCGWLMENPRGMLRKLDCVAGLPRVTVTYCQYGETRMKPTDLWGAVPGWTPRPACRNGDTCHDPAPRGSRTGTQGIAGSTERAVVPWPLWQEILTAAEKQSS
jgi:hypothetical protein